MPRILAIALDVLVVVAFAAVGRSSHAEALEPAGLLRTAAPFLLATLLAWVFLVLKEPVTGLWRQGLVVWLTTVVLGMIVRVLIGDGVQVAFVLVALVALAVGLLGWRGLAQLLLRGGRPGR